MKLLTIAIPCYNSEKYMEHAIESVLHGGSDVEILLIDDGSTDGTPKIIDDYAAKYPDLIRAIHQENKGHGGAVNTGLREATGHYFKVLDSDDWLDEDAFGRVLDELRALRLEKKAVDMFLCNYVYEKPSANSHKVIRYTNVLPVGQVFSWSQVRRFKNSQNILMHAVIYRTKVLRDCKLHLPEHTFYVDNLFVYEPLPYVRSIYYMDLDLYYYFIGREDQSVNESVMIDRIDQQLLVNRRMIDAKDLSEIENKGLRDYMAKYLTMIMIVSSALLIKEGSKDSIQKRNDLWTYLKLNKAMYHLVNRRIVSWPMQFRTYIGKKIVVVGYYMARKVYGFN